ncbi:MAG: hypothetical protein K5776_07145, partial [Lachnospiraceae bacterium]|nr:hypothetical protein [Lachnospiraceae bacterium]
MTKDLSEEDKAELSRRVNMKAIMYDRTVYRKLNETAKVIELEDVNEVCFMSLYSVICMENETPVLPGEQNWPTITDILVVSSVDSGMNEKEYIFEGNLMSDPRYVADVLNNG